MESVIYLKKVHKHGLVVRKLVFK